MNEQVNRILEKKKYILAEMPVGDLKIDPSYQRSVNYSWISRKKKSFDEDALGVFIISKRNDSYYIMDGQHRSILLRELLMGNKNVSCKIYFDLTPEEEAKLFTILNDRNKITPHNEFHAKMKQGDKTTMKIICALNKCGLSISSKHGDNHITAIKATYNSFKKLNEDQFIQVFRLLKNTWNGESKSLEDKMINAMSHIILKAGNYIKDDEFISRFKTIPVDEIINLAKAYTVAGRSNMAYAKVIVDYYNGKKQKNRIPLELIFS